MRVPLSASILTAAASVFGLSLLAHATTFLTAPPPAVQLSVLVPPDDFGTLQNVLANFASTENLEEPFKNPPRATGKIFFLDLARLDASESFIFEEKPGEKVLHVYGYRHGYPPRYADLDRSISHLIALLSVKWQVKTDFRKY
jgi:hypothetical protein